VIVGIEDSVFSVVGNFKTFRKVGIDMREFVFGV